MKLSKALAVIFLAAGSIGAAVASPTYTFVGSWRVNSGPVWYATDANGTYTTPIYSGVEAAAVIFGGAASDYVTSTVDSNVANIDFNAWYDGYGQDATVFSGTFHADPAGSGLYAEPLYDGSFTPTWSAWVSDHDYSNVNFAFKVTNDVPEPESLALFGVALAGLVVARRKAKRV